MKSQLDVLTKQDISNVGIGAIPIRLKLDVLLYRSERACWDDGSQNKAYSLDKSRVKGEYL